MGVSGSGKTTIGEALAARLGWPYEEGDKLHPEANVAKMRAGIPLTDADRAPWLAAVAARIDQRRRDGKGGIVSCSALKRAYRRAIIGARKGVRLVYLRGDQTLIAQRMAARRHHFMPPSLLQSQFETLEEPGPDEAPIVVDVAPPPAEIVATILRRLGMVA